MVLFTWYLIFPIRKWELTSAMCWAFLQGWEQVSTSFYWYLGWPAGHWTQLKTVLLLFQEVCSEVAGNLTGLL